MRIFSFRKIRRLFSFASMGIARSSGRGVRRRNAFKQRRDAFSAWRLNSEQLEPKKMLATDISTRLPDLVAGDDSGYLDDVIRPHNTRKRLSWALATLRNKKLDNPWKKHGNIPL